MGTNRYHNKPKLSIYCTQNNDTVIKLEARAENRIRRSTFNLSLTEQAFSLSGVDLNYEVQVEGKNTSPPTQN